MCNTFFFSCVGVGTRNLKVLILMQGNDGATL